MEEGVFCYKVMPFGLKNTRATYQRMMNKVFKNQIGRNLEVYLDDILFKSKSLNDHLVDLKENFIIMKNNKVKINPTKCVFGGKVLKFLGFMLIERGIKINLAKCKAILEMISPIIVKEV